MNSRTDTLNDFNRKIEEQAEEIERLELLVQSLEAWNEHYRDQIRSIIEDHGMHVSYRESIHITTGDKTQITLKS